VVAFAEWLQSTRFSVTIQTVDWIIPLLQSIHIVMIGVVFVSILVVALRVLGRMRTDEPFVEVWRRFSPWFWSALAVMALTGVLLVIGEPVRQATALSFWLKMALVAVGVASAAAFGRVVRAAAHPGGGGPEFSAGSKSVAVATVVLWLAIIFLGRAIGYDIEIWESLSPVSGG
jgi:putative copper export protein